MSTTIRRIPRKQINREKWNLAVNTEQYPSPYGLCWWLDAVTDSSWEGLIMGDYQLVLPIPFFLKVGPLALVNGAPFTQHLGPFGEGSPEEKQAIVSRVSTLRYVRKLSTLVKAPGNRFRITSRNNYELNLLPGYGRISKGYRADLRRKLRRNKLSAPVKISAEDFIRFYLDTLGEKISMSYKNQGVVHSLLLADRKYGEGACYALKAEDSGEMLGALFLAKNGSRIVNLMAASTKEGYKQNAMAVIIDSIIREYASRDILLDFEGSDIPGVASFFSGFGASRLHYYQHQDKRLVPISFP
ncbi:hypothetical protein [Neolewinella agarilytica]|uniref:Acetyltransferase (GNAT) domain-containing protein n=1 Tax=Neolewinella agarilytica TaxID=478744 RepID=A0A1H9KPA4_9BACT|nr:hypothetical protein [Neolewinella agarilytica]SER00755.1 hypothetical protein SAMN05444359_12148 [Neolewinella agarilytica]